MDWISGVTGAAAGASGMLSLLKLWSRLRPKPLKAEGAMTDYERDYLIAQVRAQGKLLHEVRETLKDMNTRLVAVEGR